MREKEAPPGLRGTLDALAPEMFDFTRPIDRRVDIWALGVMTYELLHGYPPFFHPDRQKTLERIRSYSYDFRTQVSNLLKHFLGKLLKKA